MGPHRQRCSHSARQGCEDAHSAGRKQLPGSPVNVVVVVVFSFLHIPFHISPVRTVSRGKTRRQVHLRWWAIFCVFWPPHTECSVWPLTGWLAGGCWRRRRSHLGARMNILSEGEEEEIDRLSQITMCASGTCQSSSLAAAVRLFCSLNSLVCLSVCVRCADCEMRPPPMATSVCAGCLCTVHRRQVCRASRFGPLGVSFSSRRYGQKFNPLPDGK